MNCNTYEKEGNAIFRVFEKLDYVLTGENLVHIFADNRNILFVFASMTFQPTLGRNVVSKLQR